MKLTFLGAAGTVTGSKTLVEGGGVRVLVDCGLFQGVKALRKRNWKRLPLDPASLDAVVLTHAHLDHSGYLPALVRDGFEGPVLCTPPTRDLLHIMLPDAGRIQEEDAEYANRKGFSRHKPALPLYTEEDAHRSLGPLESVDFGVKHTLGGLELEIQGAGHILGAGSALLRERESGRSVLFSGDLGRDADLVMLPPEPPARSDWIVVESTYGDRHHPPGDPIEQLADVLRRTVERGGVLLIPSFAVGRAQTLLYCLYEIRRRGLAPDVPVHLNSPMATRATKVFSQSVGYHRLPEALCDEVCALPHYVRSVEESKELSAERSPRVIISASGMATGGRVLHHLKALLPDSRHTVLLVGFQAPGTRGDALAHGTKSVKIHGGYVPVRAHVEQLDLFSAHADQEGLLGWLRRAPQKPKRVLVNHGEPVPSDTLRRLARDELGLHAEVAEMDEELALD